MPARVQRANEVSINGFLYPIVGGVRSEVVSGFAPKIVIGDATKDSHTTLSVLSWSGWRGGIGIERSDGVKDTNRAWWSTWQLGYDRHMVLPWLATTTAASGVAGVWETGILNERAGTIFAAFGTTVSSYNFTTDAWTSSRTLAAVATHSINVRMGGKEYLVIAQGTDYDYYDGTTWARSTKDTQFLAWWDDRLWGIDSTGQLWWTTTIGTNETNDAQLALPNDSVTNLFVCRAPDGELILYVTTTNGLYAHDFDRREFVYTEPHFPYHPDAGKGVASWRDTCYISAGLAVYAKQHAQGTTIVGVVGPDRDHGLPANRRGVIRALVPGHNELYAIVDATASPSALTRHLSVAASNADVIQANTGYSHILGWNGTGWEVKWLSSTNTLPITAAHLSNAYGAYRLWWAHNQRILYMRLPRDISNPTQVTTLPYAASAQHETFDFMGVDPSALKLAVRLYVEGASLSASETLALNFALNGSTTYTLMDNTYSADVSAAGLMTASGLATYYWPSLATPSGTAFRSIRFRVDGARGANTLLTPDMLSLTLEWRQKPIVRFGHQVTVLVPAEGYPDQSAESMFDNLQAAVRSNARVEFTYRDRDANDAGTSNPYNYYMDIVGASGVENTGQDWSGQFVLSLVEV